MRNHEGLTWFDNSYNDELGEEIRFTSEKYYCWPPYIYYKLVMASTWWKNNILLCYRHNDFMICFIS